MKPVKPNQNPCNECPYRKKSLVGWLGGNNISMYTNPITFDVELPCHKTMGKDEQYCTGLAMVRSNSCKSTRNNKTIRSSETAVRDNPEKNKCFLNKWEFIKHHKHETSK